MKIRTEVTVVVEKANGDVVQMTRTRSRDVGDNPKFERSEISIALDLALGDFRTHHALTNNQKEV